MLFKLTLMLRFILKKKGKINYKINLSFILINLKNRWCTKIDFNLILNETAKMKTRAVTSAKSLRFYKGLKM